MEFIEFQIEERVKNPSYDNLLKKGMWIGKTKYHDDVYIYEDKKRGKKQYLAEYFRKAVYIGKSSKDLRISFKGV